MMKPALSPAAAGLLRALLQRAGVDRNRILLTDSQSTDWRSLTFAGERHRLSLRITGPDAFVLAEFLTRDLGDVDFAISGHVVADIAVEGAMIEHSDGAVGLTIEALTIED